MAAGLPLSVQKLPPLLPHAVLFPGLELLVMDWAVGGDEAVVICAEHHVRRLALLLIVFNYGLLVLQQPDVTHRDLGEGARSTWRGSRGTGRLRGKRHYFKERAWTVQESDASTVQSKQAAKIATHNNYISDKVPGIPKSLRTIKLKQLLY